MKRSLLFLITFFSAAFCMQAPAQPARLHSDAEQTMLKATQFMVEETSTNGGYVWYYLPDFSRRWGEMEAYKTMIWLQHPGTISMGHMFLDAYHTTGNEYYYRAAQKAAAAIIWGQSHEGGWNYMVDFAGDRSLKTWYNTIGKNGWRLEEFQHYYGNSTFDDDVTSDAARFLLRMYVEKFDPAYKPALQNAISFVLKSQYPMGGWPQRFPLRYDFNKHNHPDYTSFYTFNDDVIWENVHFLIQCYLALGEERFLDPVMRGMNFYLISQHACGAWGQQLDLNMNTAGARTYEPAAFLPSTTCENAQLLLKFYEYTGNKKFLEAVPAAISWLEKTILPENEREGQRTHPTFVDTQTNKPIYVHRKGSNVTFGYYYTDTIPNNLLAHYYGKCRVDLQELKHEYQRLRSFSPEEVTRNSPILPKKFEQDGTPQSYHDLNRYNITDIPTEQQALEIIRSLDSRNRWLTTHAMISNPYIGDGVKNEPSNKFANTMVGDETDTSPFRDMSDQLYISTSEYIKNMYLLMNYIRSAKSPEGVKSKNDNTQ